MVKVVDNGVLTLAHFLHKLMSLTVWLSLNVLAIFTYSIFWSMQIENYCHFIIMLQGMLFGMFLAVMEVGYNDQEWWWVQDFWTYYLFWYQTIIQIFVYLFSFNVIQRASEADEPSRSSYQRILLIGPLALALALARRYNWSRAAL